MLLATGEFVQCGYQSHMALFPLLKTARVASGENSSSMLYLYLLTYLLALLPPVTKFFRRKYLLTNSQVAELWKIREHKFKHYSNTNKMRRYCSTPRLF
jgi:hypothetical protein